MILERIDVTGNVWISFPTGHKNARYPNVVIRLPAVAHVDVHCYSPEWSRTNYHLVAIYLDVLSLSSRWH